MLAWCSRTNEEDVLLNLMLTWCLLAHEDVGFFNFMLTWRSRANEDDVLFKRDVNLMWTCTRRCWFLQLHVDLKFMYKRRWCPFKLDVNLLTCTRRCWFLQLHVNLTTTYKRRRCSFNLDVSSMLACTRNVGFFNFMLTWRSRANEDDVF